MVQTLSMYEFLHRAISDYVDLYRNKDEEYEYSVPVGAVQANGTTKVDCNRCIRNQHSAWCIRLIRIIGLLFFNILNKLRSYLDVPQRI